MIHAFNVLSAAVQVLHQSRLKAGPANEPTAAAFLDKLRRQKQLYSAPFGSNDDWYWLYAAVQAGMAPFSTPETQELPVRILSGSHLALQWSQTLVLGRQCCSRADCVFLHMPLV